MGHMRLYASKLDMYRKVPMDLLEGTKRGSFLSYAAIFTMVTLFVFETRSFLSSSALVSDVALDSNEDSKIRINFNVTMMDLACEYAVVDLVSQLGTAQNVTSHVSKYSLDARGVKERYKGRNQLQNDVILSDTLVESTIEELHENGEDAVSLDATTLEFAKDEYEFLFVDFYASWCSHCQHLAPTWEVLAEIMTDSAAERMEHPDFTDDMFAHLADGDTPARMHQDYDDGMFTESLKAQIPVVVAKVDCVDHKDLCTANSITGYPTLRLYVDGSWHGDYNGDRTVLEMVHWLTEREKEHKSANDDDADDESDEHVITVVDSVARARLGVRETQEEMLKVPDSQAHKAHDPKSAEQLEWKLKLKRQRTRQQASVDWMDDDHPGCQISGFLWVDRVPGNFHIQARSNKHDIAAHMTNVSHEVHSLTFGNPGVETTVQRNRFATPDGFNESLSPMDGNVYINHNEHEAFHHYMKVVTTQFDDPHDTKKAGKMRNVYAYQILSSSQLSYYRNDIVPEAKFSYDLSPIAVHYRYAPKKRWYDYLTNLMAIIGGTFTVIGMLENSINAAISKKRR